MLPILGALITDFMTLNFDSSITLISRYYLIVHTEEKHSIALYNDIQKWLLKNLSKVTYWACIIKNLNLIQIFGLKLRIQTKT